MTSMEENLDGRQAQLKATSMEDKFKKRPHQWKNGRLTQSGIPP